MSPGKIIFFRKILSPERVNHGGTVPPIIHEGDGR
jgi:hypothetical protein